jgi:hypothetical protein
VRRLRVQAHEIPSVIVGSLPLAATQIAGTGAAHLSLGNLIVWLGLDGVDEVYELDCVLYKEHRHVIPHDIPAKASAGVQRT